MRNVSIKEKIVKAVDEFNKYRAPEARAKLILVSEKSFKIEFAGSFCRTCGYHDYFDDFRIFLEEIGLKTKITEVKEIFEGSVVKFDFL